LTHLDLQITTIESELLQINRQLTIFSRFGQGQANCNGCAGGRRGDDCGRCTETKRILPIKAQLEETLKELNQEKSAEAIVTLLEQPELLEQPPLIIEPVSQQDNSLRNALLLGGGYTAISIMPLVTRQANQGRFFVTATEPPDWLDGDLWSDTTTNILKLNNSGTAEAVGGSITIDTKTQTVENWLFTL